MSQVQGKQTNYLGIGAAVVILAIVLIAVITQATKPAATDTVAVENTVTDPAPTPVADTETFTYEDGTYTVNGSYSSPAGPESLGVTVTLKDDVITAVSVEPKATNPASVNWQNTFAANYTASVIGKKIEDVQLGKISGSSLTPKGFNDAINKIQAEAEIGA